MDSVREREFIWFALRRGTQNLLLSHLIRGSEFLFLVSGFVLVHTFPWTQQRGGGHQS